jgi:hypothetical protein
MGREFQNNYWRVTMILRWPRALARCLLAWPCVPFCDGNPMSVHDYLLDHSSADWAEVLRPWHWLLPGEFTIWLINRYGDIFFVLDDGTVHMFDVGGGTVKQIAGDRDNFMSLIDEDDNANQWFMIPLVDKLVAAGVVLEPGCCYGFRQPPVLGGDYTVANTVVIPIGKYFLGYARLHEQFKDLPDGTEVKVRLTDGST